MEDTNKDGKIQLKKHFGRNVTLKNETVKFYKQLK